MKIGILTSGGDCPGINATIRGVCKTAINHYGMEVYGIRSGFRGLLDNDIIPMDESSLTGLLNLGGTILGTSREKPFKKKGTAVSEDKPALLLQTIRDRQLDCIVCIGGNGTQKTAAKLAETGVNVVSIPKTIDNDVWGTDVSFGFDSAVSIATDAIDRLHSTASAHQRVMVIEVMGHKAGWIALYSGMAGGGDIILLPEIPFDIHRIGDAIINRLKRVSPTPSWWWQKVFLRWEAKKRHNTLPKKSNTKQDSRHAKRCWATSSAEEVLRPTTVTWPHAWEDMPPS